MRGRSSHPIAHEKRFASYVLNTLLGGGMSSRLFQNIRERQGSAYSIYSDLSPYLDTGCLSGVPRAHRGSRRRKSCSPLSRNSRS